MNKEKLIPIAKGMIKYLPGAKKIFSKGIDNNTEGTIDSRYCYTIWMRHLINWYEFNTVIPKVVVELGPGDSLGTGFAALLSGSKTYIALDIIKYGNPKRNLTIFNELIQLFRRRACIPDNNEYTKVKPKLNNYNFPSHILTDDLLNETLKESRIDIIRNEILNIDNQNNTFIKYIVPWNRKGIIQKGTVDFIYSQAVLEYIDNLDYTYSAMHQWLKPFGLMSHTIDYKSHGITKEWNGHWMFNDIEWKIVRGGKKAFISRKLPSEHIKHLSKNSFKILKSSSIYLENKFDKTQLAKKFRNLSEIDNTTSGSYILARKE